MFAYIQINCCTYFSWVAQDFCTVPYISHSQPQGTRSGLQSFQPHVTGITMFESAASNHGPHHGEISSLKAFETPLSGNIS